MQTYDPKKKRRDKIRKDLMTKKYHEKIVPDKKKKKIREEIEEVLEDELDEFLK